MKFRLVSSVIAVVVMLCFATFMVQAQTATVMTSSYKSGAITYPDTPKGNTVDEYHGVKVPDPYRWLEDPDSTDSQQWITAQNKLTNAFLNSITERRAIQQRLTEVWNYERYSSPINIAGKYFYFKNDGLQNHSVLYMTKSLDDPGQILLDPNTFSKDGTVALSPYSYSRGAFTNDGKLLVYGISDGGSDWVTLKVIDVETRKHLSDEIHWVKFSGGSWTKDGRGFFYSRFDKPEEGTNLRSSNFFQKVYYHKLGTPQSEDKVIFQRIKEEEKNWSMGAFVTDDGRYLIIAVRRGTERKHRIFYKDLTDPNAEVVGLINEFEDLYSFIDNIDTVFYFRTFNNAPKGRVIAIDITNPAPTNWKEIVPESENTLEGVGCIHNQFYCSYMKDATSQIKAYDMSGKFIRDVKLPGIGSAAGFGGKRADRYSFYTFESFTQPDTIYRYDCQTGESKLFRESKIAYDPDGYASEQVFFTSKDGTRVPMFITYKKGLKRDGSNPAILYGYGGFNISLTPWFSAARIPWLEMGGIYAVPNLRGGGEYGKAWHLAGCKLNRQNVFDDFIAAAEYLIKEKYTTNTRLAINGGSNGGLLVGACMLQRPDLFGAAIPEVGVLDMLRFHKFTIGHAWTSDYGCADNPEEFKVLNSYSPVHNTKKGESYPPTLIMTADHDDRVVPAHSFKFAAALQEAQGGSAPILIRIETRTGHAAGKPTSKRIEEAADRYGFLLRVLGIETPVVKEWKKRIVIPEV